MLTGICICFCMCYTYMNTYKCKCFLIIYNSFSIDFVGKNLKLIDKAKCWCILLFMGALRLKKKSRHFVVI